MSLLIYQANAAQYAIGDVFALCPSAGRHVQVLRKQPGDGIRLFNGNGVVITAEIQTMQRKCVEVKTQNTEKIAQPASFITLITGLIASDRMDWLVEKATELGANRIQPVLLKRSVVRLAALQDQAEHPRSAKKRQQWEQVAIAACEQSGRAWLPSIEPIRTLEQAIEYLATKSKKESKCLLSLHPESIHLAKTISDHTANALVFASGGEGGFEASEEELLLEHEYKRTSLGASVLRAETAPIAAIAMSNMAAKTIS